MIEGVTLKLKVRVNNGGDVVVCFPWGAIIEDVTERVEKWKWTSWVQGTSNAEREGTTAMVRTLKQARVEHILSVISSVRRSRGQ